MRDRAINLWWEKKEVQKMENSTKVRACVSDQYYRRSAALRNNAPLKIQGKIFRLGQGDRYFIGNVNLRLSDLVQAIKKAKQDHGRANKYTIEIALTNIFSDHFMKREIKDCFYWYHDKVAGDGVSIIAKGKDGKEKQVSFDSFVEIVLRSASDKEMLRGIAQLVG